MRDGGRGWSVRREAILRGYRATGPSDQKGPLWSEGGLPANRFLRGPSLLEVLQGVAGLTSYRARVGSAVAIGLGAHLDKGRRPLQEFDRQHQPQLGVAATCLGERRGTCRPVESSR